MKTVFPDSYNSNTKVLLRITFIITAILTIFILNENIEAVEKDFPFYPGEKLTFQLKWTVVPAGEGTLEILPIETIKGVEAYHFVLTAKSNSFIDYIYKVRDRIDAYTDIEMTHTILYKKKQREGKTKRDVVVNFNWDNNKAQYSTLKNVREPIDVLKGSFDPLSAFYYTRLFDLKENLIIERPVTDGKKCIIGKAFVIKRETLKLASGTKIQVWVTADKRRIPVKIKSKVVVGSFVGELVSATGIEKRSPTVNGNKKTHVFKFEGQEGKEVFFRTPGTVWMEPVGFGESTKSNIEGTRLYRKPD
jgi:hypothetical protein